MTSILRGMVATAERRHLEDLLDAFQRFCSRAYWEGLEAAGKRIRKEQNPHPQDSAGFYFWLEGYNSGRQVASRGDDWRQARPACDGPGRGPLEASRPKAVTGVQGSRG